MTNIEVLDGLREMIRQTSDDSVYSDEFLFLLLNNARLQIMRQYIDANKELSSWLYQRFCIKLCPNDFIVCGCTPMDFGCKIYRSVEEIPKPMSSNVDDILFISELQGDRILPITENEARFMKYKKYKPKMYYMISDVNGKKYLFILSDNIPPKYIKAEGIFEDPTLIPTVACTEETCFNPLGSGFPLPGHLLTSLYKLAIEFIGISMKLPEDNNNNSNSISEQ